MGSVAGSRIALRPKSRHWRRPWNWVLGLRARSRVFMPPRARDYVENHGYSLSVDRRFRPVRTGGCASVRLERRHAELGNAVCIALAGAVARADAATNGALRYGAVTLWFGGQTFCRSGQMVRECQAGTSRTSHKQLNCHFRESGNDPHDIRNCPDETLGPPPELGRCLRTDCCAYVTRRDTVTMLHHYGYSDSLYV